MGMMLAISDKWINLNALWKICVVGLICGAGLPAIFAIGLRLLSLPGRGRRRRLRGRRADLLRQRRGAIGAGVCFVIVLVAIGLGIFWIVSSS